MQDMEKLGLANRFLVRVNDPNGGTEFGSWTQVQGLEVTWDIADYRAGDHGNHRWLFRGATKYQPVKMTRAACADSKKIKDWLDKSSYSSKPNDFSISLLDTEGNHIMDWELRSGLLQKWAIVGFEANSSKIALETLELAHDGFIRDLKTFS